MLCVGACDNCIKKRKAAHVRKISIICGTFLLFTVLSCFIPGSGGIVLAVLLGLSGLGLLAYYLERFPKYNQEEGLRETIIANYRKNKIVPQKDILAMTDQTASEGAGDINVKEVLRVADPYSSTSKSYYDLQLFTQDELSQIGELSVTDTALEKEKYAVNKILEAVLVAKAKMDAEALFQKVKVQA